MAGTHDTGPRSPEQELAFEELKGMARDADWRVLDDVRRLAGQLHADGRITEDDFAYVWAILDQRSAWRKEASRAPGTKPRAPDSYVGSRPISRRSLPDRRMLARENWILPEEGRDLTNGEMSVLSVVAEEIMKFGACRLCVGKIAAIAGVSARWVQHSLRKLADLAMIVIERRPRERRRHDTNVVAVHPNRPELTARIKARKRWWRGRGPSEIGRTLLRPTRLKVSKGVGLPADKSFLGPSATAGRAAEGQSARTGPSRTPYPAPG